MPLAASRFSILFWSVSLFDAGTVSSSRPAEVQGPRAQTPSRLGVAPALPQALALAAHALSYRPIVTPIAAPPAGPSARRSSATRQRAWQSGSRSACHRLRRSPAGTTRQSGRLLPGRPGWQGKTDSHAAGDRLVPRRATGGDVNDPNWAMLLHLCRCQLNVDAVPSSSTRKAE